MRAVRVGAVVAALGVGAAVTLGGAAPHTGTHYAAKAPGTLAGDYWKGLSAKEQVTYLTGFLAGASTDSVHAPPELRFRFAPSVYAAQLNDYYWYTDHTATSIVDALTAINKEMLAP